MNVDQNLTEHNTEEMKAEKLFSKYSDDQLKKFLKTLLVEGGDNKETTSIIIKELDRRGV